MASIIVGLPGCNVYGRCPVCGSGGLAGASCNACVRAAYQRALHVSRRCEVEYADVPTIAAIAREHRNKLLAGLTGHDLIRDILPGARMQAPEAP